MKRIFYVLSLLALLPAGGCHGLTSSAPPPAIYALHASQAAGAQEAPPGAILTVAQPKVSAGFDTERIALYTDGGRKLDYYAGARWPEDLPDTLQDVIVESLHRSMPGTVVATADLGVPAGYVLSVDVIDFGPVYAGDAQSAPRLDMALRFALIKSPQETVLDDFILSDERTAAQNSLGAIVAEMEKMLQKIMQDAAGRIAPQLEPPPPCDPANPSAALSADCRQG